MIVGAILAAGLVAGVNAQDRAVNYKGEKAIVVVAADGVETQIVVRIRAFVHENVGPVRPDVAAIKVPAAGSRGEVAKAVQAQLASNDLAALVLVKGDKKGEFTNAIYVVERVAVVDVAALWPTAFDAEKRPEGYVRRIDKESTRALGLALGLPPCPFFQCCMMECQTEDEMDSKGRNQCPPCRQKLDEILAQQGVTRVEDVP